MFYEKLCYGARRGLTGVVSVLLLFLFFYKISLYVNQLFFTESHKSPCITCKLFNQLFSKICVNKYREKSCALRIIQRIIYSNFIMISASSYCLCISLKSINSYEKLLRLYWPQGPCKKLVFHIITAINNYVKRLINF